MKLTLKLGASELKALYQITRAGFVGYPVKELKSEVGDYLILSCLEEFYSRLEAKYRQVAMYGLKEQQQVKISLKRYEAIALLHLIGAPRSDNQPFIPVFAPDTFEAALISTLDIRIKQVFI